MDLKYLDANTLVATLNGKKELLNRHYNKLFPMGENRLLFLSGSEGCCCFDITTWNFLWADIMDEKGFFVDHEYMVYHNNIIYCGRSNKDFTAIDPVTGNVLWKYYAGAGATTFMSDFSFYKNEFAFFHSSKSVFSINLHTHTLAWKIALKGLQQSDKGFVWQNFYVLQTIVKNTAFLNFINVHTGEIERQIQLGTSKMSFLGKRMILEENVLHYISQWNVYCRFDLLSGVLIENKPKELSEDDKLSLSDIYLYNDKVYLFGGSESGDLKHGVYEFDLNRLRLTCINNEADAISGFTVFSGRYMYLRYKDTVSVMDITTGEKKTITLPDTTPYSLDKMAVIGDKIFVSDCGEEEIKVHSISIIV